ncbi:MAG: hypothetical protein AAFU70_09445, partial [Planctomycetota bacterium]
MSRLQYAAAPPQFDRPEITSAVAAALATETMIADAGSLGGGFAPPIEAEAGTEGEEVAALDVPAPGGTLAIMSWVTVDPYFAQEHPSLAARLPRSQPLDAPVVSVQASFDAAELRARLDNPPPGQRPIPRRLIGEGLEIIAVEIERQARGVDGSWSDAEVVSGPGWVPSLFDNLDAVNADALEGAPVRDVRSLTQTARIARQAVIAPPPPRTISGDPLVLPEDDGERNQWASQVERLDRLQEQLEDVNADIARREARNAEVRQTLRDRQQELSAEVQELDSEVRGFFENAQASTAIDSDTALSRLGEAVPLLGYDLAAEPGVTYRYRTRVVLNNPLYGESQLFADNPVRADETRDAIVRSEWSSWSEPVDVLRASYFFVRGISLPNAVNAQSAAVTVDLYAMYYGHYRSETVLLEPGDPVRADLELEEAGRMFTYDLAQLDPEAVRVFLEGLDDPNTETGELPAGLTPVDASLGLGSPAVLVGVSPSLSRTEAPSAVFADPINGLITQSEDTVPAALRATVERSVAVGRSTRPYAPERLGVQISIPTVAPA